MEGSFRFIRTHDNKFVWTDNRYKIVFSNPYIHTADDYALLTKDNSIIYFYYNIEIYTNSYGKWELFSKTMTYDFPAVFALQYILKVHISEPVRKNAQRFEEEDDCVYEKYLDTKSFINEDFYAVKRNYRRSTKAEWYDVTVGIFDRAVIIQSLLRRDILALKNCVLHFLKYSYKLTNQIVLKERENAKDAYFCEDGCLFEKEWLKDRNSTERAQMMYFLGDSVDLDYVSDDGEHSIRNRRAKISEISDDSVTFKIRGEYLGNGSFEEDYVIKLPPERILYTNLNCYYDDEELSFDKTLIAKDFYSHLNDKSRKDFKSLSADKLVYKYSLILKTRYCLYKEQHEFNTNCNIDEEHIDKVCKSIAETIRKLIQESK